MIIWLGPTIYISDMLDGPTLADHDKFKTNNNDCMAWPKNIYTRYSGWADTGQVSSMYPIMDEPTMAESNMSLTKCVGQVSEIG